MSEAVASPFDCCVTCDTPATVTTPGNPGEDGTDGTNGTNGSNAYTVLTAAFTMPAEGATDTAFVAASAWMTIGQKVFLGGGGARGTFEVTAKPTALSVTLLNVEDTALSEYLDNSPPATVFPIGTQLSPSGLQGPDAIAAGGALLAVNNLIDVANAATSRTNLGLGTAALRVAGNANLQVPFVNNAAGLINAMPVFATAAGIETKANLLLSRAALGIIFGTANTNVPIVDDAANLTVGELLMATASGIESVTPTVARTALGLGGPLFRAHRNGVISSFPTGVPVVFKADVDTVNGGFDPDATYDVVTWRWTPGRVGYYILHGQLQVGVSDVASYGLTIFIYKNGVAIAEKQYPVFGYTGAERVPVMDIQVSDFASLVTDYYQIFADHDYAGNLDFDGNALKSYFEGHRIL